MVLNGQGSGCHILSDALHRRLDVVKNEKFFAPIGFISGLPQLS
jgi:hypothetical protein